jgi:hypothetical protein
MTDTIIELSEDDFDARYPLRTNHLNPSAGWAYGEEAGCLFETYGEELAFVRQQDPRTVWTFIDGDDGAQYVLSGFHLVNRIGYLISTVTVPEGTTIEVRIPMQSGEDTVPKAHTPGPWRITGQSCRDYEGAEIGTANKTVAVILTADAVEVTDEEYANARRIVAAVNACEDFSTKVLERGMVIELLDALHSIADHSREFAELEDAETMVCRMEAKAKSVIAKVTGTDTPETTTEEE